MERKFHDWLEAYLLYTASTEAPQIFHLWAGIFVLASCLRRCVWFPFFGDDRIAWAPNFYIIFVAPPAIANKSTTGSIALDLLQAVPAVNIGPDTSTVSALIQHLSRSVESIFIEEREVKMSSVTYFATELGHLINFRDDESLNMFIDLYDGRTAGFERMTRKHGVERIEAPLVNILACTTPHWIQANIPKIAIGGGFTSRCVFVWAHKKQRLIAYPYKYKLQKVNLREDLINDLIYISETLRGPMHLTEEAEEWGEAWYEENYIHRPDHLESQYFDGYIARRQSHLHRIAMIVSVSHTDDLTITKTDLQKANTILNSIEFDMHRVFSRISATEESSNAEHLLIFVKKHGRLPFKKAFQLMYPFFPKVKDFESVVLSFIKLGYIKLERDSADEIVLVWEKEKG